MLRWLLAPFALLYLVATTLRNYLYSSGYFHSQQFDRTVISVGNLNVGGSGKTPLTEYLITNLSGRHRVATLSRGYKRTSTGFRKVNGQDTAATVGDEPLQMFLKFGDRISVFVGEDRALAIPCMLAEEPEIDIILLDDAFQHRAVQPRISIVVTDAAKPFFEDYLLPVGRLRESRGGVARADLVIVTKCPPAASLEWRSKQTTSVRRYLGLKPVLFSAVQYQHPVGFGIETWQSQPVFAVTGIAQVDSFIEHLSAHYRLCGHLRFPDHHPFSDADVEAILAAARRLPHPVAIMTTEKDFVRLAPYYGRSRLAPFQCFYIPIEMTFLLEDGKEFAAFLADRMPAPRS